MVHRALSRPLRATHGAGVAPFSERAVARIAQNHFKVVAPACAPAAWASRARRAACVQRVPCRPPCCPERALPSLEKTAFAEPAPFDCPGSCRGLSDGLRFGCGPYAAIFAGLVIGENVLCGRAQVTRCVLTHRLIDPGGGASVHRNRSTLDVARALRAEKHRELCDILGRGHPTRAALFEHRATHFFHRFACRRCPLPDQLLDSLGRGLAGMDGIDMNAVAGSRRPR